MTYAEMIDRAYFQALRGLDAKAAPNLDDATVILEAMAPTVFQAVAESYAGNFRKQSLLRRTHNLTVANGTATLPAEVLTSCLLNGSIGDSTDVTVGQLQSFVPQWADFIQPRDAIQIQLNYWTVRGDQAFHYLEANEEYDPTDGFDGTLEITVPSVPEIPATSTSAVDVPDEVASDLIEGLANALRVEIKQAA